MNKKKTCLVIFCLLVNVVSLTSQNLTHLLMNKDICHIEIYLNGSLEVLQDYVADGNKVLVYTRKPQTMQSYLNEEYIFNDSAIEVKHFYKDGYMYLTEMYSYENGDLRIWEFEDLEQNFSDKIEYLYNSLGNLTKEVGERYEKTYLYSFEKLVSIETLFSDGDHKIEQIESLPNGQIHLPCYDLYIEMDKKVIERTVDSNERTDIITYFLNNEVYEEQKFIFTNDKVKSVRIVNTWKKSIEEYRFFYK